MKRFPLVVMLFIITMIAACSVAKANAGGVGRIRLFSATAEGTQESVAKATEKLNNEISQWLNRNPALKIIEVKFKNTSTGNLPKDAFAYNTVFVTITVAVHYTSQ